MRKTEISESVKIIGNYKKEIIKEKNLKVRYIAHDSDLDVEALTIYVWQTNYGNRQAYPNQ